jgi:hypothetical protein
MELSKLREPENLVLLPLATYGLLTGIYKYCIARPLKEAVQVWVDSHTLTQEELDDYILTHSNFDVDHQIGYNDVEGINTHE